MYVSDKDENMFVSVQLLLFKYYLNQREHYYIINKISNYYNILIS